MIQLVFAMLVIERPQIHEEARPAKWMGTFVKLLPKRASHYIFAAVRSLRTTLHRNSRYCHVVGHIDDM